MSPKSFLCQSDDLEALVDLLPIARKSMIRLWLKRITGSCMPPLGLSMSG